MVRQKLLGHGPETAPNHCLDVDVPVHERVPVPPEALSFRGRLHCRERRCNSGVRRLDRQ